MAGLDVPQPEKLLVNILDGEVIALWRPPADAPSNTKYNVQMAKYVLLHNTNNNTSTSDLQHPVLLFKFLSIFLFFTFPLSSSALFS